MATLSPSPDGGNHTAGGIGASVPRLEDDALLRGEGMFTDDVPAHNAVVAVVVRSPHAHARIRGIETSVARACDGVLAVYTAADLQAAGIGHLAENISARNADGTPAVNVTRPLLAETRVMCVGDAVALVIASSGAQAREAADCLDVDYEELPAVTGVREALAEGAPQLYDEAHGNIGFHWTGGNEAATRAAFAKAQHVTELEIVIGRVSAGCMETRGAVASYDLAQRQYVIHAPTQGANKVRDAVAAVLGVSTREVRVLTHDVGGAFGIKLPAYPEYALVAFASRALGRTVKWIDDRTESFMSDGQCRDHVATAALALDADGKMLAVRCDTLSNMGAYSGGTAMSIPSTGGIRCLSGVYAIGTYCASATVAFTNTVPVTAFRGAGKPEYNYIIERLVDVAAREMGVDGAELRRRNAVPSSAMPYRNAVGIEFDSGEFVANMDIALERIDADRFIERRAQSEARGRLRGLGFAMFQEPDGPIDCRLSLSVDANGALTVTTTSQAGGQGHETFLAQLAAERLGLASPRVAVVQGDSDRIGPGGGTGGSNLATVTGTAFAIAADQIVERGKAIAALRFEANEADVEFVAGRFAIVGTDRGLAFGDVAAAAFDPASVPPGGGLGWDALVHHKAAAYSFPCGCHACEVEIDPETGKVDLLRYVAIDDHGVAINPMLLEGQAHGGIAQGIGEVLLERIVFDPESGQLLSGSLMDYCLPRADDLPWLEFENHAVPCKTNALGAKGVGESGCTASLPAVTNAVVDALSGKGVRHVDLPVLPETVWRLCNSAGHKA